MEKQIEHIYYGLSESSFKINLKAKFSGSDTTIESFEGQMKMVYSIISDSCIPSIRKINEQLDKYNDDVEFLKDNINKITCSTNDWSASLITVYILAIENEFIRNNFSSPHVREFLNNMRK